MHTYSELTNERPRPYDRENEKNKDEKNGKPHIEYKVQLITTVGIFLANKTSKYTTLTTNAIIALT